MDTTILTALITGIFGIIIALIPIIIPKWIKATNNSQSISHEESDLPKKTKFKVKKIINITAICLVVISLTIYSLRFFLIRQMVADDIALTAVGNNIYYFAKSTKGH